MKSSDALGMVDGKVLINGPMGATGVTKLSTFVAGFILVLVVLTVTLNLIRAVPAVRLWPFATTALRRSP